MGEDWLTFLILTIVWTLRVQGGGGRLADSYSASSSAFSLVSEGWGACFSDELPGLWHVCRPRKLLESSLALIYLPCSELFYFVVRVLLRASIQIASSKMFKVPPWDCVNWGCSIWDSKALGWLPTHDVDLLRVLLYHQRNRLMEYTPHCLWFRLPVYSFFWGSGSFASFCLLETYISRGKSNSRHPFT